MQIEDIPDDLPATQLVAQEVAKYADSGKLTGFMQLGGAIAGLIEAVATLERRIMVLENERK